MDPNPKPKVRLAEQLIASGLLTEAQLRLALHEQKRNGGPLGQVLMQLGFVEPQILAEHLAAAADTKLVSLQGAKITPAVVRLIPLEMARRFHAMPVSQEGQKLTVALADPFDVVAIDTLQQYTGLAIEVITASQGDILDCQDLYYSVGDSIEQSIEKIMDDQARSSAQPLEGVLTGMGDRPEDAPVIRLVSRIVHRAINSGASDIHFEPEERSMRIRTRVDGIMFPDILIPKTMQSAVSTRMKILADLDVAETRIPQDGRATIQTGGREVNLRVSSLPTSYGENIVARILDPKNQVVSLSGLGLTPDVETQFREAVNKPYGVVLVTGPTGSGKTTTLYAVLREVSTMEVTTFTLEDPIEYRMPLVRQTQIKDDCGLTFSAGLRALLRQDPDNILVGETRDTETAQLMVRAALTGHMVFSTLHTNDAAGAIPRLVDMGVEPYLLPACLNAVMGQRLVRTICPHCKEEVPNAQEVLSRLKVAPPGGETAHLWRGKGCPLCKNSGYKGRRGIYELMVVTEAFHDPIVARAGAQEYMRLAQAEGMKTMFEDGLLKAMSGTTTMEELLRLTRMTQ